MAARIILILLPVILLFSCGREDKQSGRMVPESGATGYASGFRIESRGDLRILYVADPWQGSRGHLYRYILAGHGISVPDSLSGIPLISVPVSRVICMSTTHIAMIKSLGKSSSITGISGKEYVSDSLLRKRIEMGTVRDVGADRGLNYELIVSLEPDILVAYGITGEINGMVNRLGDLGIPVVLNGDYLEEHPLGKLEWIRFLASLYQEESKADSIFREIETRYIEIQNLASTAGLRPLVMTGLPWKGSWYVPGGSSFAASFIRDAGAEFIREEGDGHEALPYSLESVYSKAVSADFWINCGSALSLAEIENTDQRLTAFKAFQSGEIYNNTARMNPSGGNDIWESGVMEPHIILADLVHIFHPDLLPDHEPVYYEKLE